MNQQMVTLQRKQGERFGFQLCRASNKHQVDSENDVDIQFEHDFLALHEITAVVEDSCAYRASLCNGDRLLEVNGHDVRSKSFEECTQLIRNSDNTLRLKVIRLYKEEELLRQRNNSTRTSDVRHFLKQDMCIHFTDDDNKDDSIIDCFEKLKPNCKNPEGLLHPAFNTIIDEPLDVNTFSRILNDSISPADSLIPYIIDSLKRYHALNDIITCLSEIPDVSEDSEALVDQLTKRMLLVQVIESMSYDSQRFLCNFIRKNDLPIPLSYRVWLPTEKTMQCRVNFNCLMETLCTTDLRLFLQFGSPSASGLGKTSLLGYLFNDKRRKSLFAEATDRSWRDGCTDVLFSDQFVIFDIHGTIIDTSLLRSIQLYTSIQMIYLTEEDLEGDFLSTHTLPTTQTIAVVFDPRYDDVSASTELLKRFEEKFQQLGNVVWTSAPHLNAQINLPVRITKRRNKRLRERFSQLLEPIKSDPDQSFFRSCFQIQTSFHEITDRSQLTNLVSVKHIFEVEKELDRLFSPLTDQTENLLLVTPTSYTRSATSERFIPDSGLANDFLRNIQTPGLMNDYHMFTISLLTERTYIELLIVEKYLEKWRGAYVPKLRDEQDSLRENASELLKILNQAGKKNLISSEVNDLRQKYDALRTRLKENDYRLMNVDLTVGLLCDELFTLWDYIHLTQSTRQIEEWQNTFDLLAQKLAEIVSKGFTLHILRGRPLQSQSRLLKMCLEKLYLGDSMAVLTVIGAQSSAKSSLLNSTFGCNFRVSAGRCTIGLYLGLVYYQNTTIIILDTEGLMSLEESGSIFDNQMVTMAVLSSNLVLVNHKGDISSNLEDLIGMSLYAKIQIQSSPFKPRLIFVLRDQTQRDMKIFQQQLKQLKENLQSKGQFLRGSIDEELEMKDVVLMPSAFTEDIDPDYDIAQKWRSEPFASDINKLRTMLFEILEDQMNETADTLSLVKNFNSYLYSKLIINWKSISDLGEGLLRCQSLHELTVQNELKDLARQIIADRHDQLQIHAHELIETLIQRNIKLIYENLDRNDQFTPHIWIKQMINEGRQLIKELIDEQIDIARETYDIEKQRTCFAKVKSQWDNIHGSIANLQQHLCEQLDMRILDTTLQTNRDYYRREFFQVKKLGHTSNQTILLLNQRFKELEEEISISLQTCKRNKEDIIQSTLNIYENIIQTKNEDIRRRSIYNLCPSLDNCKYQQIIEECQLIIQKFVNPFLQTFEQMDRSLSFLTKNDDQYVLHWFTNGNDQMKNERILNFVIGVLLRRINHRLNRVSLQTAYSDPKVLDELISIIDSEVHSIKIDISHIHRPSFIHDLIIFMLYLLFEKTNQRLELKHQQLLNQTLNDLQQIKENVLDQLDANERVVHHGQFFRRILSKEIIREIERINRQKLLGEIHRKFNQQFAFDPTDITRHIYYKSIHSEPIDRMAILKFVTDPSYFCVEQLYLTTKNLCQQFIENYVEETKKMFNDCLALMTEIILRNDCTDAHVLHQMILQQIALYLPGFQISRAIEIENNIEDPHLFQEYFRKIDIQQTEDDDIILKHLIAIETNFQEIFFHECVETLTNRTIGCQARCPGCGMKCELPSKHDPMKEHHHFSRYHLPMAFHGWPRDKDFHPNLSMCYQQWTSPVLYRGDDRMSSPQEFFASEALDWYEDVHEKSKNGKGHDELYPLEEHRRAWMSVRYKLIKDFGLRDQESYHSGIYPTDIFSLSNDSDVLWAKL